MEVNEITYGLRHIKSGAILSAQESSNGDAEFCNDTTTTLDTISSGSYWTVASAEHAEWVRNNSTPWYNSAHDTPKHNFKAEELEVVQLEIKVTATPVIIPLSEELYIAQWGENGYFPQPKELARWKREKAFPNYSLYDLKEYFKKVHNKEI